MTLIAAAELRYRLRAIAQPNPRAWAISRGVSPTYLSDVLRGVRPASRALLDAAGMTSVIPVTAYEEM